MQRRQFCVSKYFYMQTLQHTYNPSYIVENKKESILTRFFAWCKSEENNRYGWLAAIIALHGCVLTPVTVLIIFLGGNNMVLWGVALGAMAMTLVTNLAAMSTKITIPVFFLSILIDLVVMAISLSAFFIS